MNIVVCFYPLWAPFQDFETLTSLFLVLWFGCHPFPKEIDSYLFGHYHFCVLNMSVPFKIALKHCLQLYLGLPSLDTYSGLSHRFVHLRLIILYHSGPVPLLEKKGPEPVG